MTNCKKNINKMKRLNVLGIISMFLLTLVFSCTTEKDEDLFIIDPVEPGKVFSDTVSVHLDSNLYLATRIKLYGDSAEVASKISYTTSFSKVIFKGLQLKKVKDNVEEFILCCKAKSAGIDTIFIKIEDVKVATYAVKIIAPEKPVNPKPLYTIDSLLTPTINGEYVKHKYYQLSYIEKYEGAEWVSHLLTKAMVKGTVERDDDFRADPLVKTGTADENDYSGTGYDRGHLCPAGDMKISETAMSESFFMSNMSPQNSSFNRGMWSRVEDIQRELATAEDSVIIISGPIFKDNIETIGKTTKITVPGYYFKIVYDITGEQKMTAWLFPNKKLNKGDGYNPEDFIVSVDKIEQETGIDFFRQLPDEIENKLEK
jgi:endonuclease G